MFERQGANVLDKWAEAGQAVTTPEINSTITWSAIGAALICLLPLFGLETFIYFFILWGMYKGIANKVGLPFNLKAIVQGVVVNCLICLALNAALGILIGIGDFFAALGVGFATYASGHSYLGVLYKSNKAKIDSRRRRQQPVYQLPPQQPTRQLPPAYKGN